MFFFYYFRIWTMNGCFQNVYHNGLAQTERTKAKVWSNDCVSLMVAETMIVSPWLEIRGFVGLRYFFPTPKTFFYSIEEKQKIMQSHSWNSLRNFLQKKSKLETKKSYVKKFSLISFSFLKSHIPYYYFFHKKMFWLWKKEEKT